MQDQKQNQLNANRIKFYHEVVEMVEWVCVVGCNKHGRPFWQLSSMWTMSTCKPWTKLPHHLFQSSQPIHIGTEHHHLPKFQNPTVSQTYFQVMIKCWWRRYVFCFSHIGYSKWFQMEVTITIEAERLTQALSKYALGVAEHPLFLLSFDESNTLTVAVEDIADEDKPKPTYFTCLWQAIWALIRHSVFSFFLSTTSEVFQFMFSPPKNPSSRSQEGCLHLFPPYSDVSFDQLALKVYENMLKIEDVAKVEFMVKLDRPLFHLAIWPFLHYLNRLFSLDLGHDMNMEMPQSRIILLASQLKSFSTKLQMKMNP